MLRNLLSGVAGGAGLILAAVGLSDGVKWPVIGLGVVLIAASLIGFFSDWAKPKAASAPTVVQTVTSHQQSGGITAHTVTIAPQARSFQGHDLTELRQFLVQFAGTSVPLSCGLGDGEASSFAQELKTVFESVGWHVDGVTQVLKTAVPPAGVALTFAGTTANAPQWMPGLGQRLMDLGFHSFGVPGTDKTQIYVGHS